MRWLTEEAVLVCQHELGIVAIQPTQDLVRVQGLRALVAPDPVARPITGCPNVGATIKPCTATLAVRHGYSPWVRIHGSPVALSTVVGLTDGTPPGVIEYKVRHAGQDLIVETP